MVQANGSTHPGQIEVTSISFEYHLLVEDITLRVS
jgi:hypothetical protein